MKRGVRTTLAIASAVSMILLAGCTGRELEDRYFPLAMEIHSQDGKFTVEYALPNMGQETGQEKGGQKESEKEEKDTKDETASGDTVEEACKSFQQYVDKYIDGGHLKALILGPEILKSQDLRKEVLQYLENQSGYGRNMLVFCYQMEKEESLITKTASSVDTLGTYLTGLIENNPNRAKSDKVTLGELLDFWHNQEEQLQVPSLELQNEKPVSVNPVILEKTSKDKNVDNDSQG